MYLFYIDESGSLDPKSGTDPKGGQPIYVLTALGVFVRSARKVDLDINRHKMMLIDKLVRRGQSRLELSDCEIKSNWLRRPDMRAQHPLLQRLDEKEINELVTLFYKQLDEHHITILSVIIDKQHLREYMDPAKLHRKAWELLLQKVEQFMRAMHEKHHAILIADDVGRAANRRLAMKHAYIMLEGTSRNVRLEHICEMPLFVPSELCNGVQLADLCAYNIYRVFTDGSLKYKGFEVISPNIWSAEMQMKNPRVRPFHGLYVFPQESKLKELVAEFEKQGTPAESGRGSSMVSGGANPIEPTSGTGRVS